jgi:hypothetical protein
VPTHRRMTDKEFRLLYLMVISAYHRTPTEMGERVWREMLEDFPFPDVLEAIQRWIRSEPQIPTVADIIAGVRGIRRERIAQRELEEFEQNMLPADPEVTRNGIALLKEAREKRQAKDKGEEAPG